MAILNTAELKAMFEANRQGWNTRTAVHKESEFYDVPSFKAGKTTLNKAELEALGDVSGKTLLHVQCHFGLDTLSWAREGALVTGVDLSDLAIETANELKSELNIEATFLCANVYDLPEVLHEQYDIVFTSYGVIGWLPDMNRWAQVINHCLKPGGTFYMIEFHPVVWMLDENLEHIKYHYHNAETISETSTGTYADPTAAIEYSEHSWNHSLSEVLNALINNGITVQQLNEYPYSYYNCFKNIDQGEDGYWRAKGLGDKLPMMYSVMGVKG